MNLLETGIKTREEGKYDDAVRIFHSLVKEDGEFIEAWIELARTLLLIGRFDQRKYEEAIKIFQLVLRLDSKNIIVRQALINALSGLNQHQLALQYAEQLVLLEPEAAYAFNALGLCLEAVGQLEQARVEFEKAISLDPFYYRALYNLSYITKFKTYEDELLLQLLKAYEQSNSLMGTIEIAFALAKAYDNLADYDRAWQYLAEANQKYRETYKYSIDNDKSRFENIKKVSQKLIEKFQNQQLDLQNDKTVILIVGMPRSGTSLAEQILASHSKVFGAGELFHLQQAVLGPNYNGTYQTYLDKVLDYNPDDIQARAEEYLRCLRAYSDKERITVKMPSNIFYIAMLKLMLPNSKVIYCKRNSMDICFSIFKNYLAERQFYAFDQIELGEYYRLIADLNDFFQQLLPGFIYELDYEMLVSNQEEETRKLLEFCDLDWEEDCLNFHKTDRIVATASLEQVRKPIYKTAVESWRNYEKYLEPLKNSLGAFASL